MIGAFLAKPETFRSDLHGTIRVSLEKRKRKELERSRAGAYVREALAVATDFDGFLVQVGRFFGMPGYRGISYSPVPRDCLPHGVFSESAVDRVYASESGSRGALVLERALVPASLAVWRSFRETPERKSKGSVTEASPGESHRTMGAAPTHDELLKSWFVPVEGVLSDAMDRGLDAVFLWYRRDVGIHLDEIEWSVFPLDLGRLRKCFEERDFQYFEDVQKAHIATEVDRALASLKGHACRAWLLSQVLGPRAFALYDDVEAEAAAWYLLLSAGITSIFDKDYAIDAEIALGQAGRIALSRALLAFDPAVPNPQVLRRVQEYWGGPGEIPWAKLARELETTVIPSIRNLMAPEPAPSKILTIVRCNAYDELG